jgi:hypothetical protein
MSKFSVDDLLKELDDIPSNPSKGSIMASAVSKLAPLVKPNIVSELLFESKPSSLSHDRMAESTSRPSVGRRARSSLDDLFDDIGDLPSSSASVGGSISVKSKQTSPCTDTTSAQPSGGAGTGRPLSKCIGLMLGGTHRRRGRNGSSVGTVLCCDRWELSGANISLIKQGNNSYLIEL